MSFEYKPFKIGISEDWILGIVLTEYKKKIESIKTHELFENTNLLLPYEQSIEKSKGVLTDMISNCKKDDAVEVFFERKDLLYPYVCNAIKFYIQELEKNKSNIKQILGEDLPGRSRTEEDIEILKKYQEKYCLK